MRDPKLLFWNNNLYCFELIVTSSLNRKMLFATQPWKAISTQINTKKTRRLLFKMKFKTKSVCFCLNREVLLTGSPVSQEASVTVTQSAYKEI